jgi:two-component system, OmpR family, sensor kinase
MSSASTSLRVPASTRRVWYRSLYWRIALGLIAFLALMLAAQVLLTLWMSNQIAGSMPARSPRRLAVLVASDLGAALSENPRLDLERYVSEQYANVLQPFIVRMRDGRIVINRVAHLPQPMDRFRAGDVDDGGPRGRGPGRRAAEVAWIAAGGTRLGIVIVPLGRPPFRVLLSEFGPTLALTAVAVLVAGTALIAVVVFGPARRRLKQVQEAAERLGAGDLDVRAPAHGGDEVAELAASFNRMADELASRARALDSADRARRQLLADVSHELMTPLTAMRGYIETLSMPGLPLDAATRDRYLRIVDDETRRLEDIIGDLLDLARLEGGGTTFRRDAVDVGRLFERVAARHERELHARQIALARHVAPEATVLTGDSDRLEQALQNLAANALRHTPDGGEISLIAERTPQGLRIAVRDTGPGIPTEHLPHIFDRFYKVDAARRAAGGSGLGLSIVKAIVERHGGTIAARNDGGAVFEILLPTPTAAR